MPISLAPRTMFISPILLSISGANIKMLSSPHYSIIHIASILVINFHLIFSFPPFKKFPNQKPYKHSSSQFFMRKHGDFRTREFWSERPVKRRPAEEREPAVRELTLSTGALHPGDEKGYRRGLTAGHNSTLSRGAVPWVPREEFYGTVGKSKEVVHIFTRFGEKEWAHALSLNPVYQHQSGPLRGKRHGALIAVVLNKTYHGGESVRNEKSVTSMLYSYRPSKPFPNSSKLPSN